MQEQGERFCVKHTGLFAYGDHYSIARDPVSRPCAAKGLIEAFSTFRLNSGCTILTSVVQIIWHLIFLKRDAMDKTVPEN